MRSPVALLAPVLALILSACAPLPPTQADAAALAAAAEARAREGARTEAQLAVKKQIDLVARHTRAICVAPENRAYFRHTPCLPVEVTDKHLADKKLPTAAELRIAKRVFSRIDDMNRDTLAVMLQTEDPYYKELAEKIRLFYTPKIERLQNEFLTGRITWAAYNAQRKAMNDEFTSSEVADESAEEALGSLSASPMPPHHRPVILYNSFSLRESGEIGRRTRFRS